MFLPRIRSILAAIFAAAVVAAGCGEGTLSSPTGPSVLSDAAGVALDAPSDGLASTSDDALTTLDRDERPKNGKGSGKGNDKEKGNRDEDKSDRGPGKERDEEEEEEEEEKEEKDGEDDDGEDDDHHGRGRNVSGFVTALGADSITIRGVVVKVTPTTLIRHGNRRLTLAEIAVGDHAQAKGTMSPDGTTFTATEIKVEDTDGNDDDDDDEDDEDEVDVTGTVAGLPATRSCPTLTFTIGTTTVKTNDRTSFDDVTCATLANGNLVKVEGVRQADGSILASEVELEAGPNEVSGKISGLTSTTSCPTLTFTLGTTTVTTNNATVFEGVACTALANGRKVEVEGTLTGTTLAAAKVELD